MNYKHGFAKIGKVEPLHSLWRDIHKRCKHHSRYISLGVTVCAEWSDYTVFRAWATSNGYAKGLSIDRTNNNGPYSPSNCRFVDAKTQARNRRDSLNITCFGKTQTLAAWCEELSLKYATVGARIRQGYPPEIAFRKEKLPFGPSGKKRIIEAFERNVP